MHEVKNIFDLVTTFSMDVGLKFGQGKCYYVVVKRGNSINQTNIFSINNLTVSPVSDEECCMYLRVDKLKSYDEKHITIKNITAEQGKFGLQIFLYSVKQWPTICS